VSSSRTESLSAADHPADHDGHVQDQQHPTTRAPDGAAAESDEQVQDGGQRNHARQLALVPARRLGQRRHEPDRPRHGQDVEEIRTDDVAQGQIVLTPPRRDERRGQLGQARADGDEGQADDRLRHPVTLGQGDGRVHDQLTTQRQPGDACDHPRHADEEFAKKLVSEVFDFSSYIKDMKNKNINIQGIGHRIKSVTNPDVRVTIMKDYAKKHFPKTETLDYALEVEKLTTSKRNNLILNVDGCIGVLCCDMLRGIGYSREEVREFVELGTLNALFVLGRSIGFMGHIMDQKRLKSRLYRHPWDDIEYMMPDKPEIIK